MPDSKPFIDHLETELKQLIIDTFDLADIQLDDINSNDPLFAGGFGLDSIDALELGLAIKNQYGISIDPADTRVSQYFSSISSLASWIAEWQNLNNRLS